MAEYCRLGVLYNRNLFSIVLETRKSRFKAPADSVSRENPLPLHLRQSSCYNLTMAEGARELAGVTFRRTPVSFMRAQSSWLNHLSCTNIVTWGIGFTIWKWRVHMYPIHNSSIFQIIPALCRASLFICTLYMCVCVCVYIYTHTCV